MKLFIQIPCFNEEQTLPEVIAEIPRTIEGVDQVKILVVDDGSTDKTSEIATKAGADLVLRNTGNLGLAFTFRRALEAALDEGADIIVNLDGDHQYKAQDIPALIRPLLEKKADIVIGDRGTDNIEEFSKTKKLLQRFGSWAVRKLSDTKVRDVTSGFRAFSRDAALKLTVLSNFTYTLETILQARSKGLIIANVPITTNPSKRESRLMPNIRTYVAFSLATIIRVFLMYNPLRFFLYIGGLLIFLGGALCTRFIYLYFTTGAQGRIQSLIFAAILIILGGLTALVGMLADIIQFNRRLLEDILVRLKSNKDKS